MAYQMIHMEIAYRLLKQLSMVENGAEFILGAVAPDSVHMNQNYEVGMKVSSHMFEFCGKWGDTQDYKRRESNIKDFFIEMQQEMKGQSIGTFRWACACTV